jgi:hypothetical protein
MTIASHELALVEINNGKRYDERCNAARSHAKRAASSFVEFARLAAREYEKEFGSRDASIFTAEDILLCAIELEAYYRQHVAEIDALKASEGK